jgi:hypothetical protein
VNESTRVRLDEIAEVRRLAVARGMPTEAIDDAATILELREAWRAGTASGIPLVDLRRFTRVLERNADALRSQFGPDSVLLTIVLPRMLREIDARQQRGDRRG